MLKLIHTKNNSFIVDVETKPGEYRMMCEDGWTMHIKSEEITWK